MRIFILIIGLVFSIASASSQSNMNRQYDNCSSVSNIRTKLFSELYDWAEYNPFTARTWCIKIYGFEASTWSSYAIASNIVDSVENGSVDSRKLGGNLTYLGSELRRLNIKCH